MRPATFEEREHLCRLDKKFSGEDLISFVERVEWECRRRRIPQRQFLSILYNAPGATDIPEERLKQTSRKLHSQGVEMTPDEVGDTMAAICHKIRNEMASKGYDMPESDVALMAHLKEIGVTF